ncbi:MAG TPA: phosphate ABC transporter permease subunit PstC [Gemmatimonadales bacterium]|nr:phosphate ABC transporter permease subunit PstC [Gemmatimonadales bacterium]
MADARDTTARRLATPSWGDVVFRAVLTLFAVIGPFLLLAIIGQLAIESWPSIQKYGIGFIFNSTWDPVHDIYGAAPMIFGTLLSSFIALVIAVPLAVGVAIFLTEFAPKWTRGPVATLVELLAAIPSVVYGLWGIFVLIPLMRSYLVPPLKALFGWTPFFSGPFYGSSMLAAGIILAIMILPYISSVAREVVHAVPASQREAALALGATRWEAVWTTILPYARSGIVGAVVLGLGRALGETMAVTMVIGNRHDIGISLIQPGYSMAAIIANEFNEAVGMQRAALFEIGLVLFGVTILVNAAARVLVWRVARGRAIGSSAL